MADSTDNERRNRINCELEAGLQAFTAEPTIQVGARLYASLREAARSNLLDRTIQPRAKSLLRELRRVLTGPSRDEPSEVDAAKQLAADVHAWLLKRTTSKDAEGGEVIEVA